MSKLETLAEDILPAAVLDGAFGKDVELIRCNTHEYSHGEDQFASIVMFSSVKIKRKSNTEKLRLVVKFNQESEIFRQSVLTDLQLLNEVFMYENFFTFLGIGEEIVPKFYYGVATGGKAPDRDVIVMQDLCREEYHVKKDGLHLDYNHVVVAMQQLARFHAASYNGKGKHEETFFNKVDDLKEAQWVNERQDDINISLRPVLEKVVQALIAKKESVKVLQDFLGKVKSPFKYAYELLSPDEPLSVICHGDFCKENILFKYHKDGTVIDVKFVDFGSVRYASPIIDLSFFLFFNTTSALRRKHLDDFLTEYYNTLKLSNSDARIPTIGELERDFHAKAVYGFLDCCLQIPTTLSEPTDWEELGSLTKQQIQHFYTQKCDDQATNLLCDILRDLIYFKCI